MEQDAATSRRTGRHNSVSLFPFGRSDQGSVNPVVLPLNDEKSRIKVALDKLSYLKAGWDGLEALPISKGVLTNVSRFLAISDNQDWHDWIIEPNVNGTVILRSISRMAGISIGNETFSYYKKEGKNITGRDGVNYSANAVLSVMRILNCRKSAREFCDDGYTRRTAEYCQEQICSFLNI